MQAMADYRPCVLLDLDGTLVDSVFFHVVAWEAALRASGHRVPMWRIHHAIGMGGERLRPWLLGEEPEAADEISADHQRRFLEHADELQPTPGAAALLDDLQRREIAFVIATSAEPETTEALLRALGRDDFTVADSGDVGSPKPAPDLLLSAVADLGTSPSSATLVGDSPWDAEAARRVGIRCLGVRCGGFGDDRLLHAGADDVVDDPRALVGRL